MKLACCLLCFSLVHSTLFSWPVEVCRGRRVLDINIEFHNDNSATIDPRYIDLPEYLVEEISTFDTASINLEEDYAIITFSLGENSSAMEFYLPGDTYYLMRILELVNNFEIELHAD